MRRVRGAPILQRDLPGRGLGGSPDEVLDVPADEHYRGGAGGDRVDPVSIRFLFNLYLTLEPKTHLRMSPQGGVLADGGSSTGKVVKVFRAKNTALVEGVNLVKKHNKPNANNPKGGITEKEAPINLSNISLVTKDGEITRVGYRTEKDGKKVRFSRKSNEII